MPSRRPSSNSSLTEERPTATSTVSTSNASSDPGIGRNFASTRAMITRSTRSVPSARSTVCEV